MEIIFRLRLLLKLNKIEYMESNILRFWNVYIIIQIILKSESILFYYIKNEN